MLFESRFQLGQPHGIIPHIDSWSVALTLKRPRYHVIQDSQKSDKRILPNSAWRLVLQRLTPTAVPFARLRNLSITLGIDLLGNAEIWHV